MRPVRALLRRAIWPLTDAPAIAASTTAHWNRAWTVLAKSDTTTPDNAKVTTAVKMAGPARPLGTPSWVSSLDTAQMTMKTATACARGELEGR